MPIEPFCYYQHMRYSINKIIYPEGDSREISHSLRMNQLVDINGYPLQLPLKTVKTIVYRVYRKSTSENRNEDIISYYLEQLFLDELSELV